MEVKKRLMREGDHYWDPDTGYIYNLQGEIVGHDAVFRRDVNRGPDIDVGDFDVVEEAQPEASMPWGLTCPSDMIFSTMPGGVDVVSRKQNKFEYLSWSTREFDLPTRATKGSAGYDFHSPRDVVIRPGETVEFSLEVKVQLKDFTFLMIVPRSSLGFKGNNHITLTNTTGIIDSDYYNNPDNEGEIRVKLHNFGTEPFVIHQNDKLVQGIFVNYDITVDDKVEDIRIGGLGSTGN